MITAYYNEFDPKAAAWLRQLIKNGNITPGEVDERSITEVEPDDLRGYDRVHFFAGIGTWDYCLNQAGWGDKPIWTASLPCQPFSAAGKGLGKADERHLLPHFLDLVRECRPATIFGEQVSTAIRHGWLDDLCTEMESCDYAIGAMVIGAHSINSPHIRQRLYWVANSIGARLQDQQSITRISSEKNGNDSGGNAAGSSGMVDTEREQYKRRLSGCEEEFSSDWEAPIKFTGSGEVDWIYCRDNKYRPIKPGIFPLVDGSARSVVHSSYSGEQINANATQEARVMRLKGYGNAIQAQTAIAFIEAFMSVSR